MNRHHTGLRNMMAAGILAILLLALLPTGLSMLAAPGHAHNDDCIRLGNVDLDADNTIDIDDILAVRGHIFGTATLSAKALTAADVLGTGLIDIDVILAIRGEMFGGDSLGWVCPTDPTPTEIPNTETVNTLVGTVLCGTADNLINEHETPSGDGHYLIFYAVYGEGYVNDTHEALVEKYFSKTDGYITADDAQAFLDECKEKLRFTYTKGQNPGAAHGAVAMGSAVKKYKAVIDPSTLLIKQVITFADGEDNNNWAYQPALLKRADKPAPGWEADASGLNGGKPDLFVKLNGEDIRFKYIPSGLFLQGSYFMRGYRYQDEFPRKVTFDKSFYMMEIPVTQAMWEGYGFTQVDKYQRSSNVNDFLTVTKGPNKKAASMNMTQIKEFIEKVKLDNPGLDIRLPTDAEWEYAMRLGNSAPDYSEKYKLQQATMTADVKARQPNGWGLYDMQINNGYHWVSSEKNDNARRALDNRRDLLDLTTDSSKIKGGMHYSLWAPSMHGKGHNLSGTIDEATFSVFRLIVDDADAVIEALGMS